MVQIDKEIRVFNENHKRKLRQAEIQDAEKLIQRATRKGRIDLYTLVWDAMRVGFLLGYRSGERNAKT